MVDDLALRPEDNLYATVMKSGCCSVPQVGRRHVYNDKVVDGLALRPVDNFLRVNSDTVVSLGISSGLQFVPEHVAMFSYHVNNDLAMLVEAAILLTAVIEFICAEVIRLAKDVASINNCTYISCKFIMLAIRNDEDLNHLFRHTVFRDGGVLKDQKLKLRSSNESAFESQIIAKAKIFQVVCFIDPRTGLHCYIDKNKLVPAPFLDAMCKESQFERLKMSRHALTVTETEIMHQEGRVVFEGQNTSLADDGWAEPCFESIRVQRLREIVLCQRTTHLLLSPLHFSFVVNQIAEEYTSTYITFSNEAMECLQVYAENHLISLLKHAYEYTFNEKRIFIRIEDIRMVQKLRKRIL